MLSTENDVDGSVFVFLLLLLENPKADSPPSEGFDKKDPKVTALCPLLSANDKTC